MHRALHICEILLEIFAHVNTLRDRYSYHQPEFVRKSLAALAVTCKTFYEPAMNELWAVMFGLTPLLGCVTRLHPIIYCSDREFSLFTHPSFQDIEPLSENEGRQFLRHAARVRSIHVLARDDCYHLLSVLKCRVPCMFPRLLSLRNRCSETRSDIFLSPTLRRCDLWVAYGDLKVIATHCAALEHISLANDWNIENEPSLLSDCVRLCKRLVTLSCSPLDLAAWKHLSNLPTLIEVEINKRKIDPSSLDLENNLDFGPFLNLTTLSFNVNTAAYITGLMQYSDFPSLKQFKIEVNRLSWAEAERLAHVLSKCKARHTLEQIEMKGRASDVQDPPRSSIIHFCCFTQLRILWLDFPRCCIHLGNDLLLECMSSWPHLQVLNLQDPNQAPSTITFRGLFAALHHCPHLHTLNLLIDAVNIDIDPTGESFRHLSLQRWDVLAGQLMNPKAVARIIFSMLPCVEIFYKTHHFGSMSSSPPYAWPDVQRRLRDLHDAAGT
ncbi:hypothetical protein C8R48DRAFT_272544 [Suillus tomentosus]|nr:hypothetical protein C8R48DRAFT_272544 [Suillus tomentosus]